MYAKLLLVALCTQTAIAQDALLQIGDSAPALQVGEFVVGAPLDRLETGTVYVIEFSGTRCVPCIQLMPHLNQLRKKHPAVTIISVFPESADEVRTFLQRLDFKASYHIAVDSKTQMWKHWSDAACQEALPHAFIVDAAGKVAWIGHPEVIGEPLAEIVSGKFDSGEVTQRLALEQGVVLAERQSRETANRGQAEYARINKLIIRGEYEEALRDTREALSEYSGSDFEIELLRGAEVFLMVRLPEEQDKVVKTSQQYAIDSQLSGDPMVMYRCASALINAAGPEPPCRNQSLIDLAEAVLQKESLSRLNQKSDFLARELKLWCAQARAQALYIEGNAEHAIKVISDTTNDLREMEKDLPPEERRVMTDTNQSEVARLLKQYSDSLIPE